MVSASALLGIVLAVELLLAATPGASVAESTSSPASVAGAAPQTIEDVLTLKTKIAFDAQSLEFCMRDLEVAIQSLAKGSPFARGGSKQLEIKIIGSDLMLDGITRNMTVRDLNQEGTVAELLTALARKGNPVGAKAVNDPAQKLVWVIGPNPDTGKESILITTRAAATKKKYTLPTEFQLQGK